MDALIAALPAQWRDFFAFEYRPTVASTQDVLVQKAVSDDLHGYVCITDEQTAGRGRSGRIWQGGQAENLQCSLGWEVSTPPDGAMSLVVGIAIVRALSCFDAIETDSLSKAMPDSGALRSGKSPRVGLKWPNDIIFVAGDSETAPAKLGGVLVEASTLGDKTQYRIGMGLNFRLSDAAIAAIEQPVSDLQRAGLLASREVVLAKILAALAVILPQFEREGFATFLDEWEQYHVFYGKTLGFEHAGDRFSATVIGVDERGALGLRMGNKTRYFMSGELRVVKPGSVV